VVLAVAFIVMSVAAIIFTHWLSLHPSRATDLVLLPTFAVLLSQTSAPRSRQSLQRFFGLLMGALLPFLSIYTRSWGSDVTLGIGAVAAIFLFSANGDSQRAKAQR